MLHWHSLGDGHVPDHDGWLSPTERAYVDSLRFAKRRSEWRMARWTAKQALVRALGLDGADELLRRLEVRASLEPETRGAPYVLLDGDRLDVAVSLTDRAGWAACLVAAEGPVGCDLELDEPRSPAFVRDYLTPAEQQLVAEPPADLQADAVANLVWSAKESALKVLQTGLRRDTRSVEVSLVSEGGDGWQPLDVADLVAGRRFPGWWCRFGPFLLTVAATRSFPPPVSLDEPPALAGATPSHGWMAAPEVSGGWPRAPG